MSASSVSADFPHLIVPARAIPVPQTISREAQKFLAASPPRTQTTGWTREAIAAIESHLAERCAALPQLFPADIVTQRLSATSLFEIASKTDSKLNEARAVLYVHGGAFVVGGGILAAQMALPLTAMVSCKVFAIDYRMPPDHPFPAALDDALEAYRYVLERFAPHNVAIYGASAGGGLAAALILKARDLGLALPGASVLVTPEADLTESGDTFATNEIIDVVLQRRLTDSIALYANGHELTDPYLSPIFGDFHKGFPPTILISGTRDLFLSNTVILHRALRRAGVAAELHVFEAMPHGGFQGAPEDAESLTEQVRFLSRHLGSS